MTRITIIIPCFNEAESIPELIRKLSLINDDFNFLIVDNGSTDNTLEVFKKLNIPTHISFIKKDINTGYGAGIKYGIDEDADVFKVLSGDVKLIPNIFIGVFEQLEFIRRGKETSNNSRTSLLISKEDYDIVKEQIAWGSFKKSPRKNSKYLELIAA